MSVLNGVYVDEQNTIYVRKGDSGTVSVTGIPTDADYKVSLGVFNPLSKEIITETSVSSDEEDHVTLEISTDMTELIGVGRYYYAIKLSSGDEEQTVLPSASIGEDGVLKTVLPPVFIVSPKMVQGNE